MQTLRTRRGRVAVAALPLAARRWSAAAAPMFAILVLAACGSKSGPQNASTNAQNHPAPASRTGPSFEHVHGLGINPSDGALFIATHTGLFRAAKGEPTAVRVGDSEQDVMGFTIVGRDRFLGSGHPDPRQSQTPPNLGLIRSSDAGRSWRSQSLLGEADFHVLRSLGPRVYGWNTMTGALMVSSDAGQSWRRHSPPGPLIDLAIDPRNPQRIIASTARGMTISTNEGRTWRASQVGAIGLLAWPAPQRLYWIDAQGAVRRSRDGGRHWTATGGAIGGQPAAFATEGRTLYAALADGTVKRSTDDGQSWSVRARP